MEHINVWITFSDNIYTKQKLFITIQFTIFCVFENHAMSRNTNINIY